MICTCTCSNNRLGALGFMVSHDDGLWGNYGIQDQRLALQWVHDHIKVR
jgi:cholinesterase